MSLARDGGGQRTYHGEELRRMKAERRRRAEDVPVRRAYGRYMGQVGKEIASTSRPTPGRVGAAGAERHSAS